MREAYPHTCCRCISISIVISDTAISQPKKLLAIDVRDGILGAGRQV